MVDVVTVEIEHVDTVTLDELVSKGKDVQPLPETIRLIQDKYVQKVHLSKVGIPLPEFVDAPTKESIFAAGLEFGYPMMLKSKRMAYDGKGNAVVKSPEHIEEAYNKLGGNVGNELYLEKWCPFTKELAVMVARGLDDDICSYPVVETVQKDNICHTVLAPANISEESTLRAMEISQLAILALPGRGIFGVELFLLPNDDVVLNEIAPRPHNSGHYTIEACETDQFEQHLRACMGLPLGSAELKVGAAMMVNILGEGADEAAEKKVVDAVTTKSLNIPGASIHWYGKGKPTMGRKMGHVTVVAKNKDVLMERVRPLLE